MSVQRVWISDKFQLNLSELSICSVPANSFVPRAIQNDLLGEEGVSTDEKNFLLNEHLQIRLAEVIISLHLSPPLLFSAITLTVFLVPPPELHYFCPYRLLHPDPEKDSTHNDSLVQ